MLKTYWEALEGFRRSAVLCIALLMFSGLAEAFGIASLLPLLSGSLSSRAGGRSEWFGLSGDTLTLVAVGALVGLGLLAAVTRYLGESRSYTLAMSLERSLRSRMVAAMMEMRWNAYLNVIVGEGIKSVLIESSQIGTGAVAILQALGNAAIVAVFIAVAFVISPVMTGAVLVFGALTALLYRRVGSRSEALSRDLSARSGAMAESTSDLLTNAKFYRSVGLQQRLIARVEIQFAEWAEHYGRVMRYLPTTRLGSEAAGLLFIGGVLAITLVVLGSSVAGPLVFLALFYRLAPRLQQTQQFILQARTQVSWWRTWKQQYDAALAAAEHHTGTTQFDRMPIINFDAVSVAFPSRPVPALSAVSCTIAPGECLGVVGESGGGKTTLLDLVTGLLQPTAGAVRLDGVDLADVDLRDWRSHIGFVMQDAPVFHTTVLENIAWGDPAPDETRAARAVEMANLADVIAGLPDGLHTEVGQKGGRFSGGQRQRLALARALYREPWLLILDEATSALDAESEQVIQAALASLRGSCSMLIVAHRLKTVQIADRILVLNTGEVVQQGTWSELLAVDGPFRRQAIAQGLGAEPAGATRS